MEKVLGTSAEMHGLSKMGSTPTVCARAKLACSLSRSAMRSTTSVSVEENPIPSSAINTEPIFCTEYQFDDIGLVHTELVM